MTNSKAHMDEIDRQTGNLAAAIKQAIDETTAQLATLTDRYQRLTGGAAAAAPSTPRRGRPPGSTNRPATGDKKKRIRRSSEQLAATANDIVAFIKKAGAEGVKGSAIKAEFGTILPSIKEFVKAYGGKTLKTKGQKVAMTYHGD